MSFVGRVNEIAGDRAKAKDEKLKLIGEVRAWGWLSVCTPLPLELEVKGCQVVISEAEVKGAQLRLRLEVKRAGALLISQSDFFIVNPPLLHEGEENPLGALKEYLSRIVLHDA